MWGNPDHLSEMERIIRENRASETGPGGEKLLTLVAKSNKESSTYDGIDWGAERVADEVGLLPRRLWYILIRPHTHRSSKR